MSDGKWIVLRDFNEKRQIQVHKANYAPLFNTMAFGQAYGVTGEIEVTTLSLHSIDAEQTRLMSIICMPEWDAQRCDNHFKRTRGYQNLQRQRTFLKKRHKQQVLQYALIASAITPIKEK